MAKFTYASAFSLSEDPLNSAGGGSSSSSSIGANDNDMDDSCSICLEPFTVQDPATVTSCKHEYHLQCILEWSQRSRECPICWQLFALKDPSSQELLAAVEKERLSMPKNIASAPSRSVCLSHAEFNCAEDASYSISSEERLMQHLADAARRGGLLRRRDRQRSSRLSSPNASKVISPADTVNPDQGSAIPHDGHQSTGSCLNNGSTTSAILSPVNAQPPPSISMDSSSPADGNSKFRYKESISKSKQDLKEKLLARNNSLKELSNGVHREMNAGIAGVARMFERLDLASRRFGVSAPVSAASNGNRFNLSFKGKRVQENPDAEIEILNKTNGRTNTLI